MNHINNQRGFSLVEVLVTMMLIGVLTASILLMFSAAIRNQHEIYDRCHNIVVAQSMLEQVIADNQLKGYDFLIANNYLKIFAAKIKSDVKIDTLHHDLKKVKIIVQSLHGTDSLVTYIGNYKREKFRATRAHLN